MTNDHEGRKRPARVSETVPVQVFLGYSDRELLRRLASQLGASMSDVLRQGLAALERQLLDPKDHPALSLVGIIDDDGVEDAVDVAKSHDAFLVSAHERNTAPRARGKRGKP